MIFHERASVAGGNEIPVELSPQRAETASTNAPPMVYYVMIGREDVELAIDQTVTIRGVQYVVRTMREDHYVRGRFHHWEVQMVRFS